MPEFFSQEYKSFVLNKHNGLNLPIELLERIVNNTTGSNIKEKSKIIKGESNEVYSINTESGEDIIVRVSRNNNKKRFYAEKWAIGKCAENKNIPVPNVSSVEEIKINNDEFIVVSIESKLKGISLEELNNLSKLEKSKLVFNAGQILSDINSISVDGFGPLDENGRGVFSKVQEIFLDDYINKNKMLKIAEDISLDSDVMSRAFEIMENGATNYPKIEPKLVHCDFSPKHIFVDDNKISGIIDFELVEGGDPVRDIARWQFFFEEFSTVQNIIDGYSNKDIFGEDFNQRFNLWKVYLGVMQLACYSEEKNSFGINFARKQLINDVNYFNTNLSSLKNTP